MVSQIYPFSNLYSSSTFLVSKSDPIVLLCWVNNYRKLNNNTVRDQTSLPCIETILVDIEYSKIFSKIDMTNSFFQILVYLDNILLIVVNTLFSIYEWVVMPIGDTNVFVIYQRYMTIALLSLIGKICYVFMDNIIIWSCSIKEYKANIWQVLQALQKTYLYCSSKKTDLFTMEIYFLEHVISDKDIQADPSKINKILNWPTQRSLSEVQRFLGFV